MDLLTNRQWESDKSTPHQRAEVNRLREVSRIPLNRFYTINCPCLIGRKIKDMGELTKGEASRLITWFKGKDL